MDFFEVASTKRYSCRQFDNTKPVSHEKLEKLAYLAYKAPSAKNLQPTHCYVVESAEAIKLLESCFTFRYGATAYIIITANKSEAWSHPDFNISSDYVDASIVLTTLMFEAEELGLNSVWLGNFDIKRVQEEFKISNEQIPVGILALGYAHRDAKAGPNHSKKKPYETMVTFF